MRRREFQDKNQRRAILICTAAACGLFAGQLPAANVSITWNGAVGDWFDPTQWSPQAAPNNTASNLYLPQINSGTVSLSANATVSALTLASPATLNLNPNTELNILGNAGTNSQIAGDMALGSSSLLNIAGAFTLSNAAITGPGTLTAAGGAVTFLGNSTLANLLFTSSTQTATSTGSLYISQSFSMPGGTLSGGSWTTAPSATMLLNGTAPLGTSAPLVPIQA